jgi:hypothetical protein
MAQVPTLLCHGRYEVLKASVHGTTLALAAVCSLYNLAAWIARRQPHSCVNAVLYATLVAWEYNHVRHHLDCRVVGADHTDARQAA